jgi:hypothetical protein
MQSLILPNENTDYLDELLLDGNGLLKVVPASILQSANPTHLIMWGNKKGVYCLPTTELIEWLQEQISGRSAIEICSGNGAIGRALNIPRTDSYIQTTPEMMAYYALLSAIPIFPPEDVLKFEANEAVDHFKPEVVLGSYITQKYLPGDENEPKVGSSLYGVDELALLPKVKTYITIGNKLTHGDKRIRKFPHQTFQFPWLFTRSVKPQNNEISVWTR